MKTVETTGINNRLDWRTQWRRFRSLRWRDTVALLKEVSDNWSEHNVPRLGASVAFYTLLSLAPLLIVVVAVAAAVFGRDAAEGHLVWQIQDLMGRPGAETVQALLKTTQQPGAGIVASIVGTIALMLGATTAVAEVRDALNIIWCVPKRQTSGLQSVISMLRDRGLAFITVLAIGLFLVVSLAANTAISAVSEHYSRWLPAFAAFLLQWADFVIAWIVFAFLFSLSYKLIPDLRLEWRDVVPGGLVTSLLFSIGRLFIGFYLGRTSYSSVYGAAGSLVAVLVWVYYSAQIFFLGAEFTRSWAQIFGSKPCDRIRQQVRPASGVTKNTPPPGESLIQVP